MATITTVQVERLPQSIQAELFHLYSLKDGTAYASVLVNYFILVLLGLYFLSL